MVSVEPAYGLMNAHLGAKNTDLGKDQMAQANRHHIPEQMLGMGEIGNILNRCATFTPQR